MKLANVTWIFWAGMLGIAGFGVFAVYAEWEDVQAHRAADMNRLANLSTDQPRIHWADTADNEPAGSAVDALVSPRERPQPKIVDQDNGREIIPPEKTDAQLKAALDAELNRRFTCLRVILPSSPDLTPCAALTADGQRVQWFESTNLGEVYARTKNPALRKLALDIDIVDVNEEGVLIEAPSFEKPVKRFEILIPLTFEAPINTKRFSFSPADKEIPAPGDKATQDEKNTDDSEWRYSPAQEDEFRFEKPSDTEIDDFAKYVKPVEGGLLILEELPEDSPARKYGARGGEIIKAINGKPVKSMSDVRRVVREQYDTGTREFEVSYERDGVPGTRKFTAPKD